MFSPQLGFVLLFVDNPQKSALFYHDLLGLAPVEQSPTFVMFALPNGVMLGLWSKHTAEPRVTAQPGAAEICFAAEDVDGLYQTWSNKHLTIAQKPVSMDGLRTFVILDPDGHRIRAYKILGNE